MSTKTLYLHIGFHKTGTTFLQHEIYPKIQQTQFIKKKRVINELRQIRRDDITEKDIQFIRNKFLTNMIDGKNLISWEGLCGSYFWSDYNKDSFRILEDLHQIFQNIDVKIILGLREQVSLISSLYRQYLHEGGFKEEYEFIDDLNLDKFKFTNYISFLDSYFSIDNVYVYYFENFVKDKNTFLSDLLEFLGEDKIPEYDDVIKNKGYGELQVKLGRLLNNFLKTPLNPKGVLNLENLKSEILWWYSSPISRFILQNDLSYSIHYKKYRFPPKIRKKLKKIYIEDNKRLKEKYLPSLPSEYA